MPHGSLLTWRRLKVRIMGTSPWTAGFRRDAEGCRRGRPLRGSRRPERRAVRPSLLVGNQDSIVQAGLVDGLTDSTERLQPPLATLTLAQEMPDSLHDQLIAALIPSAGEFLVNLLSQIGWWRDLYGGSPHFSLRFRLSHRTVREAVVCRRLSSDPACADVRTASAIRAQTCG